MPVPSLAYFTYMIIQLIYYCKTRKVPSQFLSQSLAQKKRMGNLAAIAVIVYSRRACRLSKFFRGMFHAKTSFIHALRTAVCRRDAGCAVFAGG